MLLLYSALSTQQIVIFSFFRFRGNIFIFLFDALMTTSSSDIFQQHLGCLLLCATSNVCMYPQVCMHQYFCFYCCGCCCFCCYGYMLQVVISVQVALKQFTAFSINTGKQQQLGAAKSLTKMVQSARRKFEQNHRGVQHKSYALFLLDLTSVIRATTLKKYAHRN